MKKIIKNKILYYIKRLIIQIDFKSKDKEEINNDRDKIQVIINIYGFLSYKYIILYYLI